MARKSSMDAWGSAPWRIEFYRRPASADPAESVPARVAFTTWPDEVVTRIYAVLATVAAAPPPRFSGGGFWEAMHDDMAGFYEVRVDSRGFHYRVFCLLERDGAAVGLRGPSILVVSAAKKPFRTELGSKEYAAIRLLGEECRSQNPRTIDR